MAALNVRKDDVKIAESISPLRLSPSPPLGRASQHDQDIVQRQQSITSDEDQRPLRIQSINADQIGASGATPLNEQEDEAQPTQDVKLYHSPTSTLPRRSRGLDFARAATTLHQSMVADSPALEGLPSIIERRTVLSPQLRHKSPVECASVTVSPRTIPPSPWSLSGLQDRQPCSSSVPSACLFDSLSRNSAPLDIDTRPDEAVDSGNFDLDISQHTSPIIPPSAECQSGSTASEGRKASTISCSSSTAARPLDHSISYGQHYQRQFDHRRRTSTASGRSSMQSLRLSCSPPAQTRKESLDTAPVTALANDQKTYELKTIANVPTQRRSVGSDLSDAGDAETRLSSENIQQSLPGVQRRKVSSPNLNENPDQRVVRRPVIRRSNLLPKPQGFARVKAALLEEGAPLDTELRREAQVIRQVIDSDGPGDSTPDSTQRNISEQNPLHAALTGGGKPTAPSLAEISHTRSALSKLQKILGDQAARNSHQTNFWENFEPLKMTLSSIDKIPKSRDNFNTMCGEIWAAGANAGHVSPIFEPSHSGSRIVPRKTSAQRSCSSTTAASTETSSHYNSRKRIHDEEGDLNYLKRRAVSPAISNTNSPILPPSPLWLNDGVASPKERGHGQAISSVGGQGTALGGAGSSISRKFGVQGMNDTNDGLMNMSIS